MSARAAQLSYAAALAGAVELVVLRLFTRTAIHIPGLSAIAGPYDALAGAGRFAYYLAAVLVALALLAISWDLARSRRGGARIAAAAVLTFMIGAALARAGLVDGAQLDLAVGASVACLALAAAVLSGRAGWRTSFGVVLFAAAYLLASTSATLALGELALLVWGIASPFAFGIQVDRPALLVGALVTGMSWLALRLAESTVKVLLLWNLGAAGYLPDWSYAAALGAIGVTIAAAARARHGSLVAGMVLLVVGGIGPHSTYQSAMVLAGFAVLLIDEVTPTVTRAAGPWRAVRSSGATRQSRTG